MPTSEVLNSSLMVVAIDGMPIGDLTDVSLSMTHSPRDISNKQDAGWRRLAEGQRSFQITAAAMYVPVHPDAGSLYTFTDVYELFRTRAKAECTITSIKSGDWYYKANCFLGSATINASGVEDNTLYDLTFEGTDALSAGSVSADIDYETQWFADQGDFPPYG